jgi:hypothetical protein
MYPVLSPQLTNFAPDRQPPAAPLQRLAPLDPALGLIARVLTEALMRDGRTFDLIRKPADGSGGWQTVSYQCFEPEAVAAMVMDPAWIIGLRHRYHVRQVTVDLDNHRGVQNWHPDSPRLIALQAAAEAAGIAPSLHRTPNGLHLCLAIPEAVPKVRTHWVLRELLQRAEVDLVEVELFPSLASGSTIADAKARPASNGIRLPGQHGGALWVGDRWVDDPALIWQQLEADLEQAEVCPEWQELQEAAAALEQEHKRSCRRFPSRPRSSRRPGGDDPIEWTGTGESNRHLGVLANRGYRDGHHDPEALAAYIEAAALAAPGFDRWASLDTKRQLASKARGWAKSCIARPPLARCRPQSNDPGRNARRKRESFCSVLAGCERAAREFGEAALGWSARKIAEYTGIARTTLSRLRFHWPLRLLAILYRRRSEHPAVGGSDPSPKGGDPSGCSSIESIDLLLVPARSLRPLAQNLSPPSSAGVDHPMPTLAATVSPHLWQAAQRSREREELARWLGAAA